MGHREADSDGSGGHHHSPGRTGHPDRVAFSIWFGSHHRQHQGFYKHILNPLMLRRAGRKGFYAAGLHHVGRKSGSHYATPVRADPTSDGFVIPLPYGTNFDWLKNLMAAGSAELVKAGAVLPVDRPELITAVAARRHLPVWVKRQLDGKECLSTCGSPLPKPDHSPVRSSHSRARNRRSCDPSLSSSVASLSTSATGG